MRGNSILRFFTGFLKALVVIGLFLVVVLAVVLFFVLDHEPSVLKASELSIDDVARIREVLRENNPRRLQGLGVHEVTIAEGDLNLLLAYGFSHSGLGRNLSMGVKLDQDSVVATAALSLPEPLAGRFVNVTARISPKPDDLMNWKFSQVRIGRLPFPGWGLDFAWPHVLSHLETFPEVKALLMGVDAVNKVTIASGSVSVTYDWKSDLVEELGRKGRELLLPVHERKLLLNYHDLLQSYLSRQGSNHMSVAGVLPFMFSMAADRSRSGEDPAAENRAVLLTLAVYAVNVDLEKLVERPGKVKGLALSTGGHDGMKPVGPGKPAGDRFVRFRLLERNDLALHFLVSAAITVSTGDAIADFLGLYKELGDSMGGSGFSFADMAANRAGVEIAKLAIGSSQSALRLQQFLSGGVIEDDFMPGIDNLPEGIMELEFRSLFEDVDSAAYNLVAEEIEKRIRDCWLYRQIGFK